jgi:RNA polymerase sigma-70 factor (ECF subfamily)
MPNRDSKTPASSDPRSDAQLVVAMDRGDSAAFDALYYRHRDWVVRPAHRFTGNADDALDVMQETFTYLLSKFPGLRLSARMTTFLYPVVKNLSISVARQRERETSTGSAPDVPAPAMIDLQEERSEWVHDRCCARHREG